MKKLELRVDIELGKDIIVKVFNIPKGKVPEIGGLCLDSRVTKPGDLFVALAAARDGHEFVNDSFKKGAAAALVHEQNNYTGPAFLCGDTYKGFCDLANHVRNKWGRCLIGISGSNGKTTTKQILGSILTAHTNTLMSPGTWNNHLGVPLTLFLLKPEVQFAVLEMGMNHAQELTQLSHICEPNVAVLTGIGKAHIEHFGTLDAIADAKWELMEALPSHGVAIINHDDPYIRARAKGFSRKMIRVSTKDKMDVWSSQVKANPLGGYEFELHYGSETLAIRTSLLGKHNLSNLMCAIGVAYALEIPSSKIQLGIDSIVEPEMRLQRTNLANDTLLIEDCYNSNPSSVEAALEVVQSMAAQRKILVMGDMLELGTESAKAHQEIGSKSVQVGIDALFCVGKFASDVANGVNSAQSANTQAEVYASKEALLESLSSFVRPGDLVLVKGSRGAQLETISSGLISKFGRK